MPERSCRTCAYSALHPDQCQLIGAAYSDYSCLYYATELLTCGHCGKIIISPNPIIENALDGSWNAVCESCAQLSGTCGGCLKSTACDFETNPCPLPKAVQKTIQQGGGIIIATVKNEARVAETCAKNCECFCHDTNICRREFNTCCDYERLF